MSEDTQLTGLYPKLEAYLNTNCLMRTVHFVDLLHWLEQVRDDTSNLNVERVLNELIADLYAVDLLDRGDARREEARKRDLATSASRSVVVASVIGRLYAQLADDAPNYSSLYGFREAAAEINLISRALREA